jgi:hypothetical protein
VEGKTYSVLLTSEVDDNEAAGKQRLASISKAVSSCLSVSGKEENNSFGNPTISFIKGKALITLNLTSIDDKYNTCLTIEKIK